MRQLIVLGKGGQLGHAFCRLLDRLGRSYVAFDEDQVNFLEPSSLQFSLDAAQAVINCAAYTNVDGAEVDEVTATKINGDAVGTLGERCRTAGIPLVHFSTDYVFDGHASEPYRVDHRLAPLNAYGRSKAKGELLLRNSGAEYLLVRTSWVYAPWGNNFAVTMSRLMKQKPELKIVDDQRGRPTHVAGLAERALTLLDDGHRGDFHITDGGECTWFGFASAISEVLSADCSLRPCTTVEFPRPAKRPPYGVLDTSRADNILGEPIHYSERLRAMMDTLSSTQVR